MVSQLTSYDSPASDPIGRFTSTRSRMAPPPKKSTTPFLDMNAGCPKARNELIERHARLVASIALKFRMTNIPMEDLMAEGIQGLIVALAVRPHPRSQAQHLRRLVDQAKNPKIGR